MALSVCLRAARFRWLNIVRLPNKRKRFRQLDREVDRQFSLRWRFLIDWYDLVGDYIVLQPAGIDAGKLAAPIMGADGLGPPLHR